MKRILMILTSHSAMEDTDSKTGVWLGEFTDPYYEFIDQGYQVTLASPMGGRPPVDPMSELTENITGSNRRFNDDKAAQEAFNNTNMLTGFHVEEFDALFYPGGHGPIWDLASSEVSGQLILDFLDRGKPVGAVCHGPAVEATFEIINLSDDGTIPNSKYPAIVYHSAFAMEGDAAADFLEERFAQNGWSNTFRWRVYDYHHYHTNTHEVLGVYEGNALLQLGGPDGEKLQARPGDVIVLPAGTGHISLSHSDDFAVVGAYPEGKEPDLIRLEDKRQDGGVDKVDSVPVPGHDPLFGDGPQGLVSSWAERKGRGM